MLSEKVQIWINNLCIKLEKLLPESYVARTQQKCRGMHVGSSKSSKFLEYPTRWGGSIFGESAQHSLRAWLLPFPFCSLLFSLFIWGFLTYVLINVSQIYG